MQVKITRGLDLELAGAPDQRIHPAAPVPRVALLGVDYPDLKPALAVEEGRTVRLGEPLWHHRGHPELSFVAPGCGRISAINRGARRSLQSVVIELEGDEAVEFPQAAAADTPAEIRALLLATGLWPSFRVRPFERVPSPRAEPGVLFVTAIDTNPLCPDPRVVIAQASDEFAEGLRRVAQLAPVTYLCTGPGAAAPAVPGLQHVSVAGPHPAGLVGTHAHYVLTPAGAARGDIWHIGYQDVIAIGRLFLAGRLDVERVVAIGGPGARAPRLVRTRLGADLASLLAGEVEGNCRTISGSVLTGRALAPGTAFLGRYHHQVGLLPEAQRPAGRRAAWRRAGAALGLARDTACRGTAGGMLAVESFDRVWPFVTPPAPLLRALLIRDTESAAALGCMTLAAEDLALCSYVCPGKIDYGAELAATQHEIERGR